MFVKNVVEYLLENNFDGMEFDWEYPVCWQMDCSIGNPNDRENFSQLIRELGQAFKQRGLILSVAVSSSSQVINRAYDIPSLSENTDFVSVMAYDYNGHWDKRTGHIAPLYPHPTSDTDQTLNINHTVHQV